MTLLTIARRRSAYEQLPLPYSTFETSAQTTLTPLGDEITYLAGLAAADSRVQHLTLANSAGGRPVPLLRVGTGYGRPVIIFGGMHSGQEPAGREAVLMFAREIIASTDPAVLNFLVARKVWIVPTLNPDGVVNGTRYTDSGADVNRYWFTAAIPETLGAIELVRDTVPFATWDSHENYANPENPVEYGVATAATGDATLQAANVAALQRSVIPAFTAAGVAHGWYPVASVHTQRQVCFMLGAHTTLLETASKSLSYATRCYRQLVGLRSWFADVVANAAAMSEATTLARATIATRASGSAQWDLTGTHGDPLTPAAAGVTVTATGYTLTAEQHALAAESLAAHGITSTTPDGITYSVSLTGQPTAAVAVHLLDPSSINKVATATRIAP